MTIGEATDEHNHHTRPREAIERLPPDATYDGAIERLIFLAKIEAGLGELDVGSGIPHHEVTRRLSSWFARSDETGRPSPE